MSDSIVEPSEFMIHVRCKGSVRLGCLIGFSGIVMYTLCTEQNFKADELSQM
jgi:hypothetical protein